MNSKAFFRLALMAIGGGFGGNVMDAAEPLELRVQSRGLDLELRWTSSLSLPLGVSTATYEIQRSDDLVHWVSVGRPVKGRMGISGERLQAEVAREAASGFYRLAGRVEAAAGQAGGAEVFGYGSAFATELAKLGQITPATFAAMYPPPADYLSRISFDPTTAKYWLESQNAKLWGVLPPSWPAKNWFQLNDAELALFKQNGFVVSERLEVKTFSVLFDLIFANDLPVFVSADAALQAWHFSFRAMVKELELIYLSTLIGQVLDGMAAQVPSVWSAQQQGILRESVQDADFFLTVARSLLSGTMMPTRTGTEARVQAALDAIMAERLVDCFDLFGNPRAVDFSQFKVRGHYEENEALSRYFRCLMWLGRTDLRVAGGPNQDGPCGSSQDGTIRELGTAIVLNDLLQRSGRFEQWQQFDRFLQALVGWTDSLTFAQLGPLLKAAGIQSVAEVKSVEILRQLQQSLEQGQIGIQQIRGDVFFSPLGPEQIKLPVSFTVAGQRFAIDSWALAKVVFDEVIWDEDGVLTLEDKVPRRIPSGLDVAFAVLGNNQVVPNLVARLGNSQGRAFRDGLPYQHNLAAVRRVVDQQSDDAWAGSLYTRWLAALRILSAPTTDVRYPECLRTRAWAMRTLNTQMASWTQLRHDTLLYVKQSYTGALLCSYPYGYVEPRPEFWSLLSAMANQVAGLLARVPWTGSIFVDYSQAWGLSYNLASLQTERIAFWEGFGRVMDRLAVIATEELSQIPFSADENEFLQGLLYKQGTCRSSGVPFSGWYPGLFFDSILDPETENEWGKGPDTWDPVVADVHTDTPDSIHGDPGCILHEAVGNVNLMLIAIDSGPDRCVYVAPVFSHYEFDTALNQRRSDSEWKDALSKRMVPAAPDWTRSFLVPGP